MKDLIARPKTIKQLEEKEARETKVKIHKWDYIKLKCFFTTKRKPSAK